jgi:hypothetical protein
MPLFERQYARALQKSLHTYVPSLPTQLVRPLDGGARWGLQAAAPGAAPLELYLSGGRWLSRRIDGTREPAVDTGLRGASGPQTMTVFVARQAGADVAHRPGPIPERIYAECRGFLAAVADRMLPTTDFTAGMARDALEVIERA